MMMVLSVCVGMMLVRVLLLVVMKWVVMGLFFVFGVRGVRDACARGDDDDDELKEVEVEFVG